MGTLTGLRVSKQERQGAEPGRPRSPGSSCYHFGCLRGGRRPEGTDGCFFSIMKS